MHAGGCSVDQRCSNGVAFFGATTIERSEAELLLINA
jgi:hypothetical protein